MSTSVRVGRLEALLDRVRRRADEPRIAAAAGSGAAVVEDEVVAEDELGIGDVSLDDSSIDDIAVDVDDVSTADVSTADVSADDVSADEGLDDLLDLDQADVEPPRAQMGTLTGEEIFEDDDIVELDADDSFEILEEDDDAGEDDPVLSVVGEDEDEDAPAESRVRTSQPPEDVDVEFDLSGDEQKAVDAPVSSSAEVDAEESFAGLGDAGASPTPPPKSWRRPSSGPPSVPVGEMTFDPPPAKDDLELDDVSDVDDLLGAETSLSADEALPDLSPPPRAQMPTMEQLGSTLELDSPTHADLELDAVDEPPVALTEPPPTEELEMDLPSGGGATFDRTLRPPAEAKDELAAYKLKESGSSPRASSIPPSPQIRSVPVAASPDASVQVEAVVSRRPASGDVQVLKLQGGLDAFEPKTFVALLDASLALGE